jgi:hypothetical protein
MALPDEKTHCPQTGFKKRCRDMVVNKGCPLWIEVLGNHPQTNETIHQSVCAIAITPILLIQGNQLQGQTTASVDKVATEVKTQRDENAAMGAIAVHRASEAIKSEMKPMVRALQINTDMIALSAQPAAQYLIEKANGHSDE